MRSLFLLAVLTPFLALADDDALLSRFEGPWRATGDVRGKPVTYDASGRFVLGGAWLELSLKDVSQPPRYEARVLIGRSKKKGDYVAHWLDGFGADGARVVGTGAATASGLELRFPYEGGPFRDRFEFGKDGRFTLVIDALGADGGSEHFAAYTFVRPPGDVSAALAEIDAARKAARANYTGATLSLVEADLAFADDAAKRHVSDAFADRFLADGKIFPRGEAVVVGPDAIRALLKSSRAKWHWAPVEARVSGELGVTWGIAALVVGDDQVVRTRYVTTWRKQGKAWRIWLDIGSEGPAPKP